MIRFIIVITFLFLFLVVSLIIQPIMLLIGLFSKKARSKVSLAIVNWAFGVVRVFAGAKVTYINHESVPKDEPVLYILNHRSYFDIILTYVKVPGPTGYVAKAEMNKFLVQIKINMANAGIPISVGMAVFNKGEDFEIVRAKAELELYRDKQKNKETPEQE